MGHVKLAQPQLVEIGNRAARAAASGSTTFALHELSLVAEKIAADPRVGSIGVSAARWIANGASYHEIVRLAQAYVLELETLQPSRESVYVPKVKDELEPMLALWPDVIVLPTVDPVSSCDLIALRALPVHPLGVVAEPSWADGRMSSPAEYFFHDLDHARFKVREDLLAIGISVSDAYRDGTTFDKALGRHRVILPEARGRIGQRLWDMEQAKSSIAKRFLAAIDAQADPVLAATALLVLFEVLHEKSFPLDCEVMQRELSNCSHVTKLRQKCEHGFFGPHAPLPGTVERLEGARAWLLGLLP